MNVNKTTTCRVLDNNARLANKTEVYITYIERRIMCRKFNKCDTITI